MRLLVRLLLPAACCATALANPGRLDPTFIPAPAPNGPVQDLLVLPDGCIVIGGEFTHPNAYLAKYRPDGTLDASFDPVLDAPVNTLALDFDEFLAGGAFTTVDGVPSGRIAQFSPAGELSSRFEAGAGFDGPVYDIYLDPFFPVVGGDFDNYQGMPASNLVRLGPDGTLAADFEVNGPVNAISEWLNGGIAFGGSFTMIGSDHVTNFAAAGRFGLSSGGIDPNREVTDLAYNGLSSPSEVAAMGGSFTGLPAPAPGLQTYSIFSRQAVPLDLVGASPAPSNATALFFDSDQDLLVANADGNLWRYDRLTILPLRFEYLADEDFFPIAHANAKIDVIGQGPGARYYLGGEFTEVDGPSRPYFARLYGPQSTSLPPPASIDNLEVTDDRAYVSLDFVNYALEYIVEYQALGSTEWNPGFSTADRRGYLLGLRPDSDYLVRATARNINGIGSPGAMVAITTFPARQSGPQIYNPTPADWVGLGSRIDTILVDLAGNLALVGAGSLDGELVGEFALVDSQFNIVGRLNDTNNPRTEEAVLHTRGGYLVEAGSGDLVRLGANLNPDPTFTAAFDFGSDIRAIAVQSDGKVLVGGIFSESSDGAPNDALVRLNADGSIDTSYDPVIMDGPSIGCIEHLQVLPGDRLLVLGDFESIDSIATGQIAILTAAGEVDPSFSADPGLSNSNLDDALADHQERVLVAGLLQDNPAGGRNGVTRLLATGAIDPTWQSPVMRSGTSNRGVDLIALQPDGKILAAGSFESVNGQQSYSLARLHADGTPDPTFDPGLGIRGSNGTLRAAESLAVLPDSTIAVGGNFTHLDGEERHDFALLRGDGSPIDYNLWLASHGLPADRDPSLDDDGDRFDLGIEFGYRLNPLARDAATILEPRAGGARIVPPLQRGAQVEGRFTEDLENWQPVPVAPDWSLAPPAGMGDAGGFFRVELTPGL